MKVQEIMTEAPACCTPKDEIATAAEIMRRFDVGIVPVVDKVNAHSKLVGVVTDRDLCLKVLATGKDPGEVGVGDCMSSPVTVCTASETIEQILKRMGRFKVRRLPVVGSNFELMGLVSLDDVVRLKAATESDICKAMAAIYAPARAARGTGKAVA